MGTDLLAYEVGICLDVFKTIDGAITDTLPYPHPDFLQKIIDRKKTTEDADLLLLGALAASPSVAPSQSLFMRPFGSKTR